jgi:hypothetical protein
VWTRQWSRARTRLLSRFFVLLFLHFVPVLGMSVFVFVFVFVILDLILVLSVMILVTPTTTTAACTTTGTLGRIDVMLLVWKPTTSFTTVANFNRDTTTQEGTTAWIHHCHMQSARDWLSVSSLMW